MVSRMNLKKLYLILNPMGLVKNLLKMSKIDVISGVETILRYLATLGTGECHVIIRRNSSTESEDKLFPITYEDFKNILSIWQKLLLADVKTISIKSGRQKFLLRTNIGASEDLENLVSMLSDLTGIEILPDDEPLEDEED